METKKRFGGTCETRNIIGLFGAGGSEVIMNQIWPTKHIRRRRSRTCPAAQRTEREQVECTIEEQYKPISSSLPILYFFCCSALFQVATIRSQRLRSVFCSRIDGTRLLTGFDLIQSGTSASPSPLGLDNERHETHKKIDAMSWSLGMRIYHTAIPCFLAFLM